MAKYRGAWERYIISMSSSPRPSTVSSSRPSKSMKSRSNEGVSSIWPIWPMRNSAAPAVNGAKSALPRKKATASLAKALSGRKAPRRASRLERARRAWEVT